MHFVLFCTIYFQHFYKIVIFVYKVLLRCEVLVEIGLGQGALTNIVDATTSLPLYRVVMDGEPRYRLQAGFPHHSE